MLNWIKIIALLGITCLSGWMLQACTDKEELKNKKYSFVVRSTDEKSYIWQTDNLDSGVVNPIEKGVWLSINPDAHRVQGFHDMAYGILAARKGGVTKENCLNALGQQQLQELLARKKANQPVKR